MANQRLVVSTEKFREIFKPLLDDTLFQRASTVFKNYGVNTSFDVTNVLYHAVKQEKVPQVLEILERHFEEHLNYQHPDIRGLVRDNLMGVNPTEAMFLRICAYTLGLQPTTAS